MNYVYIFGSAVHTSKLSHIHRHTPVDITPPVTLWLIETILGKGNLQNNRGSQ
jgi:hypothetical protein